MARLRFFVGLTGASGHAYAERLVQELVRAGCDVDLCPTEAGCKVLRHERGVEPGVRGERLQEALPGWLGADVAAHVRTFRSDEIEARAASGTSLTGGVIVAPCSMGTLARVAARAETLPDQFRARLKARVARLGTDLDPIRVEQEVALLADRCDVAEEVSRLGSHTAHFLELLSSLGDADGRRLDFLLQEMMREATTLAAKAQDAEVSREIVNIKVELDRMREQVQNVE